MQILGPKDKNGRGRVVVANGIAKISIGDTEVTNPDHISEFIDNVDKSVYQEILDHLDTQRKKFVIQ